MLFDFRQVRANDGPGERRRNAVAHHADLGGLLNGFPFTAGAMM